MKRLIAKAEKKPTAACKKREERYPEGLFLLIGKDGEVYYCIRKGEGK
jgi:hypothetical protein